jgi:hypothetical protein
MAMASSEHNGNYEEGVRDGRLTALERRADQQEIRGDNHERRLVYIERIVVGMLAIVAFTSVIPEVWEFLHVLAQ